MQIAYGMLGLSPDIFWSMTLREWNACFTGFVEKNNPPGHRPEPMLRNELEELMERYPDDNPS